MHLKLCFHVVCTFSSLVNDTLDDMLTESGDEEESNAIVDKVLDEIGIEISGKVCKSEPSERNIRHTFTTYLFDTLLIRCCTIF